MNKPYQGQKAVLYARKSTESEDKQVQSIDDQIREMKAIAKDEGLIIVDVISECKSAKAPGVREEFAKMMRNIEKGKYDVVLAWDTSRLSRNPQDGGDIQWLLDSGAFSGIRTHEKWYRENDELLFTIENSMNSRFIKDLMAKVRRGMYSKAKKGGYPGCAPVGYLNDRIEKKIIKDPEMWDKVYILWRKALTGTYSVSELTRIANDELRIKTPLKKKQGGQPLCHNGIRHLLMNPFYCGNFRWGGKIYNGNHPAMITEEEFEVVQNMLDPKHSSRPQKDPYDFILRGMLTCSECGYAVVTEKKFKKMKDGTKKEYRYCHCCGKNPNKKCKFKSTYIREEELVEQIKTELSKYTIDEDFYELAIRALEEEDEIEVADQNRNIAEYNKQISDKKNQLDSLRRSMYQGLITDQAFYLSEQESLSNDIDVLVKARDNVMTVASDWRKKATDIFMFARYAKEDFDSDDWERKRTVIKKLGADLKLSGRTIQFTPVKYLVPIEKQYPELKRQLNIARTAPLQMKNDPEGSIISEWCWK